MDLKIIKIEKKPLLEREEYVIEMISPKTPSNAELKKEISEKIKKDESLILIKRINQHFGTHRLTANFYVYSTPASINKFERFRKVKKVEGAK